MTEYPYELSELSNGAFKLEFPDLPTLQLVGKSHYVLRLEAAWTLNAFLSIRIRNGLHVPRPSIFLNAIEVEDHIDFRLQLHWSMQDCGLTRKQLAKNLDLSINIVENMLDGEIEYDSTPFLEVVARLDLDPGVDPSISSIVGERLSPRRVGMASLAVEARNTGDRRP